MAGRSNYTLTNFLNLIKFGPEHIGKLLKGWQEDQSENMDLIDQKLYDLENGVISVVGLSEFAENSASHSGLNFAYKAGSFRKDNVITSVVAGSVLLTASDINYIELNPADGTISANVIGFTSGRIPLHEAVTDATTITGNTNKRSWMDVGIPADELADGWISIPELTYTYVSATVSTISGNRTVSYTANRGVKANLGGSSPESTVASSSYDSGTDKTTVTLNDEILDNTLTDVMFFILKSKGGVDTEDKAANFNVVESAVGTVKLYRFNTATATYTAAMSANPTDKAIVGFHDSHGQWETNKGIVGRNGKTINNKAEDFDLDAKDRTVYFQYLSANNDWRII